MTKSIALRLRGENTIECWTTSTVPSILTFSLVMAEARTPGRLGARSVADEATWMPLARPITKTGSTSCLILVVHSTILSVNADPCTRRCCFVRVADPATLKSACCTRSSIAPALIHIPFTATNCCSAYALADITRSGAPHVFACQSIPVRQRLGGEK